MKAILFCTLLISSLALAGNPDDFTVQSATDTRRFTLKEARGKFVALHFLLKTECPVCLRHTRDYFTKAPTLPNVQQVFIKPDDDKAIEAWRPSCLRASWLRTPSIAIPMRSWPRPSTFLMAMPFMARWCILRQPC